MPRQRHARTHPPTHAMHLDHADTLIDELLGHKITARRDMINEMMMNMAMQSKREMSSFRYHISGIQKTIE